MNPINSRHNRTRDILEIAPGVVSARPDQARFVSEQKYLELFDMLPTYTKLAYITGHGILCEIEGRQYPCLWYSGIPIILERIYASKGL